VSTPVGTLSANGTVSVHVRCSAAYAAAAAAMPVPAAQHGCCVRSIASVAVAADDAAADAPPCSMLPDPGVDV